MPSLSPSFIWGFLSCVWTNHVAITQGFAMHRIKSTIQSRNNGNIFAKRLKWRKIISASCYCSISRKQLINIPLKERSYLGEHPFLSFELLHTLNQMTVNKTNDSQCTGHLLSFQLAQSSKGRPGVAPVASHWLIGMLPSFEKPAPACLHHLVIVCLLLQWLSLSNNKNP